VNFLKDKFVLRSFGVPFKEESALDATIRYAFNTSDCKSISSVFLPSGEKNTLCISSQVGCNIGCFFCASATKEKARNLSSGEILEQIITVENDTKQKISSVLFMGIGEPLLNFDNVVKASRMIVSPDGFGLSRQHVVISSVGIVPKIDELAKSGANTRLALSLHAADDETRGKLVPEKIRYTVEDIFCAGIGYAKSTKTRLTIEYILAGKVNDNLEAAGKLAKLIKKHSEKLDDVLVNLIPLNANGRTRFSATEQDASKHFKDYLVTRNIKAIIRQPRGADINAACGQLGF